MKKIENTTWEKVFENWRLQEEKDPAWVACAHMKGWPDWASWRSFIAEQLGAAHREWAVFEFSAPLHEIPKMLLGPFPSWQSKVLEPHTSSFHDLLEIPAAQEAWAHNPKVQAILQSLPFESSLIGLKKKDSNTIICLDGHHRATAIALAQKTGLPLDFSQTPITIALAELQAEEEVLLEALLKRGTEKS